MSDDQQSVNWEERREHKRFFLKSNQLEVMLRIHEIDGEQCAARLLNFSGGGVGMALRRESPPLIEAGHQLWLENIRNLDNQKMWRPEAACVLEVRWLVDDPSMGNIGFGCRFESLSSALYDDLVAYLEENA